jgi:hypothetical protein
MSNSYPDGHEPRLFIAKEVQRAGAQVTFDSPTVKHDGEQKTLPGFYANDKRIIYLLDNRMPYLHWQTEAAKKAARDKKTFVFCSQKQDAEAHKKFHWLPLAITPGYIHKYGIAGYDFSFVGYLNDDPRKALMERVQGKFNGNVRSGVFEAEAIDTYISGRVGLNIPAYVGSKFAYDINMRVFELAALKMPMLTADQPGMTDLGFKQGVNCMMYRNGVELMRFMEILLNNEPFRLSIAEAGHNLVTQEHTYAHRAQQLLQIIAGGY